MDIMPGLSGTTRLVHSHCAVLIKVSGMKREQCFKERILRCVISAISNINSTHVADESAETTAVPHLRVADDSLLVMCVECGHKLATQTQPALLLSGNVGADHVRILKIFESVLVMCAHHSLQQATIIAFLIPCHHKNSYSFTGLPLYIASK